MRLVVLGPPGAGKGTQCARLASEFGIPHVGTGETLRAMAERADELGQDVKRVLQTGRLVADETVVAAMMERLRQPDAAQGFLLDGFPRNKTQALELGRALGDDGLRLDHAVLLEVDDETALERLSGRVVDPRTGEVYHTKFKPPPDGVAFGKRTGDNLNAHIQSLREYRQITQPMLRIYQERDLLLRVDGTGPADEVAARLIAAVQAIG